MMVVKNGGQKNEIAVEIKIVTPFIDLENNLYYYKY